MIVVDLLLLVILVAAFVGGLSRGLLGTLGGLLGLVVGGVAAFWLVPIVNDALPSTRWRGPLVVVVALALPLLGASLGGSVGRLLRRGVDRTPLKGLDRLLGGVQRQFVYMPFEHAEDLAAQQQALKLFGQLGEDEPALADLLRWAQAHHDIVARFGRFPHRNAVLGRASSADEEAFLKTPGSSF